MERGITPERQLIEIAHNLKHEGVVPNAPVYEEFVKKMRSAKPLHGQTIEEELRNKNKRQENKHRQHVYEFARFLATDPFV